MVLPVKSQLLDLVEMSFVKFLECRTGMKNLLSWAIHKAFWSLFNVMFSTKTENMTPYSLKEKFIETVVFHLLYRLVNTHSPEDPDSLLGQNTARKLATLTNPALLCDILRGINWPEWEITAVSMATPGGTSANTIMRFSSVDSAATSGGKVIK